MVVQLVLKRLFRVMPVLVAALGLVGPRAVAAQQAADIVVPVTTKFLSAPSPAPTVVPAVPLLGPRLPPLVASTTNPARGDDATSASSLAAADGRHTIVLSTLSLVLIVVLIVLLI